jgi:hypothetical protein
MGALQWVLVFVSLGLQILVLSSLLRGSYRSYPFVFLYSLVLLLTTVFDAAALFQIGPGHVAWASSFYRSEALRQFLLFLVVISFIERALADSPLRWNLRLGLVASAAGVVLLSLLAHGDEAYYPLRMTKVGRDLSFASVGLNLLLWMLLISRRTRDRDLLLATGGLGLQFTGEAIGHSLRQLASTSHSHELLLVGNLLLVGSHLLRLYVWWEVFRRWPREGERAAEEPAG